MFLANTFLSSLVNNLINSMQQAQFTAPTVAQIVRAPGSPHLGQVLSLNIFPILFVYLARHRGIPHSL